MGTFRIEASNFHWIRGDADDPKDLCLHGRVKLQLGETVIEDLGTVSATALYLLKTLTEDKLIFETHRSYGSTEKVTSDDSISR